MVKSDIGKELRRMIDIYTEKIDSKFDNNKITLEEEL